MLKCSGGALSGDLSQRAFTEQMRSLTRLQHLTIVGWNNPQRWSGGIIDDLVAHLLHLDTLSFSGNLATPRLFTVMVGSTRPWKRSSICCPTLITPLQLLFLTALEIKTVEVEWNPPQALEWNENKVAIKAALHPSIVRESISDDTVYP